MRSMHPGATAPRWSHPNPRCPRCTFFAPRCRHRSRARRDGAHATEFGQFQRYCIHATELMGSLHQRRGIMGAFIHLHGQAGGAAHRRAIGNGPAGLLEHDVEMGNGASNPGCLQARGAAVPVAIDQRPVADSFTHFYEAFDIGAPVGIGAELGLKLPDAGGVTPHAPCGPSRRAPRR